MKPREITKAAEGLLDYLHSRGEGRTVPVLGEDFLRAAYRSGLTTGQRRPDNPIARLMSHIYDIPGAGTLLWGRAGPPGRGGYTTHRSGMPFSEWSKSRGALALLGRLTRAESEAALPLTTETAPVKAKLPAQGAGPVARDIVSILRAHPRFTRTRGVK